MSDLPYNEIDGLHEARIDALSIERIVSDFRQKRSHIDAATMLGIVLVVVSVSVLMSLAWFRVLPAAFVGPAFIVVAGATVVALSVRGVILWRFSAAVSQAADMVGEMRRRLELAELTPTPLNRARVESAKVLADADVESAELLNNARLFREQLWKVARARIPRHEPEEHALVRQEWEEAAEVLDHAYDAAAGSLRRIWEEVAADLSAADARADTLLERAHPEARGISLLVASQAAQLMEHATQLARERMFDATSSAAKLLDGAEDDAARRLGFVRRPARENGRTESASERE